MKKLRQEFADTMLEVGIKNKNLVVMVADISHGILQPFAKKCPDRYFNIGICESSIVNLAAGMSKMGIIPVVHTITPFITERSYEQIKLDIGYQKENINLITVGGSFDYSKLGCSHHCYTDVSLLCHLKRSIVVIPGSPIEFNKLFKQIYRKKTINYFRLPEMPHGVDFALSDISFGKGIKVKNGKDLTIAVVGTQLKNVLEASDLLNSEGISVEIIYFHTFKPFDSNLIRSSLKKTKKLISVEELSAHDGLFNQCIKSSIGIDGIAASQMAIKDFIYGYGSYEELCARAGLTLQNIVKSAKNIMKI